MPIKESDLYNPIKTYLESQGYEVKSEIGHLDLLARRGQEPPVVVELKTSFSLTLILQGVERQTLFDHVYLAVPVPPKGWTLRYKDLIRLCRRLGLGLLAVTSGEVQAHLDPAPYTPRKNTAKSARLLREFDRRQGDPNLGGTNRVKQMTAYRQDALRCAAHLATHGPGKPAQIARDTGVTRAATILRDNHYGWFERVSRGLYCLTASGETASSFDLDRRIAHPD